jgi:hypothetical protein
MQDFEYLSSAFVKAMNDIGQHGCEKYGDDIARATARKPGARWDSDAVAGHARDHFAAYLQGQTHDHFNTRKHQLAAVAFNAMMEFCFEGLEDE